MKVLSLLNVDLNCLFFLASIYNGRDFEITSITLAVAAASSLSSILVLKLQIAVDSSNLWVDLIRFLHHVYLVASTQTRTKYKII